MAFTAEHPEWRDFRRDILEPQIERAKEALTNPSLSVEATAALRGRVAAYREIIAGIENKGAAATGGYTYADPKPFDVQD